MPTYTHLDRIHISYALTSTRAHTHLDRIQISYASTSVFSAFTHLDKVGGGHLPVVEPEGVDEEVHVRPRHAQGDVVDDLLLYGVPSG